MSSTRFGMTVFLALILFLGLGIPSIAQDPPTASFPARIVQGTCDDLDQEAIYQLADITYGQGAEEGAAGIPAATPGAAELLGPPETVLVATGVTDLDASAEDLVDPPHAVAVFESAEAEAQNAIACGPIGGVFAGQNLFFGIQERNESGYVGIGWITTTTDDGVTLTVFLSSLPTATQPEPVPAQDETPAAEGSPAAEGQDAASAQETDEGADQATEEATETPAATGATPEAADGTPATAAATPTTEDEAAGDEAAAETVTIESVDIDFNPAEVTIPADTDVTVELPNNGAILHNFSVNERNNPDVPNLGIDVDIDPGATEQVTVNAPPGDYYYYCDVPGHEAAGMYGTMHVE